MFPPVLTTEGARGWAARPGSRDDPTPGRIPVAPRISRPERVVSTRPARTDPRSRRGPNYRMAHHRARNVQVYGIGTIQKDPRMVEMRPGLRHVITFSTILSGSDSDVEYVDRRAPAPFLPKLDPFQGGTWGGNRWSAKRLPLFFNSEKTSPIVDRI